MKNISMIKLSLPFAFGVILCYLFAQQTYNLEIIFNTRCPLDSMETFGIALSSAGDVNSDGYDDFIVGSRAVIWAGAQDTSPGHAYIYYGGTIVDTIVDISLPGEHPLDLFGRSVAGLGDINCDGYGDVAVGAPNCSGIDSCGRVYIYFGGAAMDSIPDLILKGGFCEAFGGSIAAGDINGDNWNDIVVGEYWNSGGNGRVYVYYGGPLLDNIPNVIINGHNGEAFGKSVGSGGDLNSDGFEDIVVGADENSESYPGAGKVYAFFGGNPMDTVPDCWLHGEGVIHYLGWFNVDVINNSGQYDNMLTGSELWPNGFMSANNGKLYILNGGTPMDTLVDWWSIGETDSSFLGVWSTNAGDCDSNLFGDVVSGAPGRTALHLGGIGYIWLGDSINDTIPDGWLTNNISDYYAIGFHVASAGDVNGNGYDEVMFSNYVADSNQTVWVCMYTGTGIEETRSKRQEARMEVCPNPFSENLVIRCLMLNARCKIKIYDVCGREVCHGDMKDEVRITNDEGENTKDGGGVIVDTRKLSAGVYFIAITEGRQRIVKKAVKIK